MAVTILRGERQHDARRKIYRTIFFVTIWSFDAVLRACVSAEAQTQSKVEIALRIDAAPFSWVEDRRDGKIKRGFLWDVCESAVKRAGYSYNVTLIDATERDEILKSGMIDGGNDGEKKFNLLCDPTTITLARLNGLRMMAKNGESFGFSPIVFVANGSYISRPGPNFFKNWDPTLPSKRDFCVSLAREAERQDSASEDESQVSASEDESQDSESGSNGWKSWFYIDNDKHKWWFPRFVPERRDDPDGKTEFEIWGYVEGSTIGDEVEKVVGKMSDRVICTLPLKSHQDAAKEFCNGKMSRYFGDIEIVKAAILDYQRTFGKPCKANIDISTPGTYEPYAFLLSSSNDQEEFPERFSSALYSMFHDGAIEMIFGEYFTKESEYLGILFRINKIPRGVE